MRETEEKLCLRGGVLAFKRLNALFIFFIFYDNDFGFCPKS